MTDLELHYLSLKAKEIWDAGTQDNEGWRDEYDKIEDTISQEIYSRLGCTEWSNISIGADQYLWNHKVIDMEQLCLKCTGLCWAYYEKQPAEAIVKQLSKSFKEEFGEYDPIESCLIDILWSKLYGDVYDNNMYHPIRFYVEYHIVPNLEQFNKIDGAEIGGWCNVWEDEQETHTLLNAYNKLVNAKPIQHPTQAETKKLEQEQENCIQLTLF